MRSFQQIPLALCALVATAVATTSSDTISYDATVYITSTITRVNTVTASSSPTGAPVNQTSTIIASHPTAAPSFSSFNAGNATGVAPTAAPSASTATLPSASAPAAFPGAASSLTANVYLAVVAAGLGYLVL